MLPAAAPWTVALPFLFALVLTLVGTRPVIGYLLRRHFLDHPNDRSSHHVPTPRGAGLAVIPAILAAWALGVGLTDAATGWSWTAIAGGLALLSVSWIDDRRSLTPGVRLAIHAAVIAVALAQLGPDQLVFQGWLPLWADRALTGLCWLWFINLYNFMDGIDGITGVETACIGLGIAVVAVMIDAASALLLPAALACAGAALGFLVWNWHPAKVFLGDSGSVPLGFLLGLLLVELAIEGQLIAAMILPAYYLADGTITITRRALRGERIWQPHRQHFYQRAVQGGRSHAQVARAVLAAGLALIVTAMVSVEFPLAGAVAAVVTVAALLATLGRWATRGRR